MKTIKNYIFNLLYQVFIILLPLIFSPYISRVIGPEGIGLYSYSRSIANYFGLVALLGITMYGNRRIASVKQNRESLSKTFFEIYEIQMICSLLVLIVYFIYTKYFSFEYHLIFTIMTLHVLGVCLDVSWFFFGVGEFKLPLVRNVIINLITFSAVFLLVKDSQDTNIYIAILSFGRFATHFSLWLYLPRYISFNKKYFTRLKDVFNAHFKNILILFIPVIASKLYKTMDRVMLGNIVNMIEVGYYENAQSIIETVVNVLTALGTVMLPTVSKLYAEHQNEQAQKYLGYSFHMITFISVGAMFGIMGVAKTFIPLFFGEKFIKSAQLLQLLAPTLIFIGWADIIRTQYLLPKYRDKDYIYAIVIGTIINFIINLLLIPSFQSIGAVVGTVLAEMSVFFLQVYLTIKEIPFKKIFQSIIPYFIFGVIMFLVISWIDLYEINLWYKCGIEIVVGGLLYAMMVLIYLFFRERELADMLLKRVKKNDTRN